MIKLLKRNYSIMVFIEMLELIFSITYIMAHIINTWIANPLRYCWNAFLLLFMEITEILTFIGQAIGFEMGVVMIATVGFALPRFVGTCQDGQPSTPDLYGNFRTSIYFIASALVIFSRSHLMVGAACIYATREILVDISRPLPLYYVFTGVSISIVAMLYGYTLDKVYPRRMRP